MRSRFCPRGYRCQEPRAKALNNGITFTEARESDFFFRTDANWSQ
jgi:hypothetical protein